LWLVAEQVVQEVPLVEKAVAEQVVYFILHHNL
jgi:hypothetical protein